MDRAELRAIAAKKRDGRVCRQIADLLDYCYPNAEAHPHRHYANVHKGADNDLLILQLLAYAKCEPHRWWNPRWQIGLHLFSVQQAVLGGKWHGYWSHADGLSARCIVILTSYRLFTRRLA